MQVSVMCWLAVFGLSTKSTFHLKAEGCWLSTAKVGGSATSCVNSSRPPESCLSRGFQSTSSLLPSSPDFLTRWSSRLSLDLVLSIAVLWRCLSPSPEPAPTPHISSPDLPLTRQTLLLLHPARGARGLTWLDPLSTGSLFFSPVSTEDPSSQSRSLFSAPTEGCSLFPILFYSLLHPHWSAPSSQWS